ncbi:hypothetical protein ACOBQX_00340 [Actinokineospora sp. G85]|uniref:hypothetical protein n=1 Tax=Actinokineospora sp. G85 TaxID=3406626 RepID=UPI003C73F6C9
MSARMLLVELRRSAAIPIAIIITSFGVTSFYILELTGQTGLWQPQWTMLAGLQRVTLVMLWPAALAAGAWQARRDRRSGMTELVGTTSRPAWSRSLPAAFAVGICAGSAYLVVTAAGAVAVSTPYHHLGWAPIALVGALSLVAAAWLGLGVGRLLPSVYTPPVLAVGSFIVLLVPIELGKYRPLAGVWLLTPNLPSPLDELITLAPEVSGGQAALFAGLALAGLAAAAVAKRRFALVALVPAGVGLVAGLVVVSAAPATGLRLDPAAAAEVCTTDDGPKVCVLRAHADDLDSLTGPARQALARMAVLPTAPTVVREVVDDRPGPQPANEVWFASANHTPGEGWTAEGDALSVNVLAGGGTRPCGEVDYRERGLTAAWLWGAFPAPGPPLHGNEGAERLAEWERIKALPEADQLRWLEGVRAKYLACPGGGAP